MKSHVITVLASTARRTAAVVFMLLCFGSAPAQQYGCAGWPIARSPLSGPAPTIGTTFYLNSSYEYGYTCSYNRLWVYMLDFTGITAAQLFPLSLPACSPPCYVVNPDAVFLGINMSLPIPNQPGLIGFQFRVQCGCVTPSCFGFYNTTTVFTVQ